MPSPPIQHELLKGAYEALYRDLEQLIPQANGKSVNWDQTQLMRLALNRGSRFFTIDLPEFGKHFDACLSRGSLIPSIIPGFSRLRTRRGRDARPRLFWAFTSRVFKFDGTVRALPCTDSILAIRQLCRLFAKFKGECDDFFKFEAIKEFYGVERDLDYPDLDWDDPDSPYLLSRDNTLAIPLLLGEESDYEVLSRYGGWVGVGDQMQRVFDYATSNLQPFDPYAIECRHGPGAVSDGSTGRSKYSFPVWSDKLESVFPYDWHASTCFTQDGLVPNSGETFSKLICVPKTMKGPRLIAAEPISHQWIQQGLSSWLVDSFSRSFVRNTIKIHDQTHNQKMARLASFGNWATVDLSSASDRLSCRLVESVFRRKPDFLSAMIACRTSLLRQSPQATDRRFPQQIKLKKFASMGSALTFPVQSYVFSLLAISSVLISEGLTIGDSTMTEISERVAVYGDDIIVPVKSLEVLGALLRCLGLKVNQRKTYGTGKFRESCGADWYNGVDVTPYYIRSDFDPLAPSTVSTIIQSSNNFHEGGFWRVADYLLSRLPRKVLSRVAIAGIHDNDELSEHGTLAISGLRSYCGDYIGHLKRRYNKELHRDEVKIAVLTARRTSREPDGVDRLRQYLYECPPPYIKWEPSTIGRPVPAYRERWHPLYEGGDTSFLPVY